MVSATDKNPRHHVSLTKSGTTVSFNLCDANGKLDRTAIIHQLQPRLSIKMSQGGTKYSDYAPPYATWEKRDWSGGRGWNDEDTDVTRFFDSRAMQTWKAEELYLGPRFDWGTGDYTDQDTNMWETTLEFIDLDDTTSAISAPFVAGSSYSANLVFVILKASVFSGGTARISLYSDNAGVPNAELVGVNTNLYQSGGYGGLEYAMYVLDANGQSLTATTTYHVVISGSGTGVACTAGANTGCDYTSSSWNASYIYRPYFMVTGADKDDQFTPYFFNYEGVSHVIFDYDDNSAPRIFINGDFGRATSATTTTLVDSGASWTADEWIGAYVRLHDGAGSEVFPRYYKITDNDATSLTVAGWEQQPDNTTFYAITNTNIWKEITGHGIPSGPITSVFSAAGLAYICRGDRLPVTRMRYPTLSTGDFTDLDNISAVFMQGARWSVDDEFYFFKANNLGRPVIDKSNSNYGVYYSSDTVSGISQELDFDEGDITNGNMEADSTWTAVGTPTTEEQSNEQAKDGTYSWKLVCDADAEGITQAITVNLTDMYLVQCWVYVVSGSANGVKLTMGGDEIEAVGVTEVDKWIWLHGYRTAQATSENIQILSDGGAASFYVDSVRIKEYPKAIRSMAGSQGKITNMIRYGEPERLWVLAVDAVAYEGNGRFINIPINELYYALDERNGRAACIHDVYLFFSFLDGVERYYKSNLDDVGPNRDEGLPTNRRGIISDLQVYPGRILCAVDGGSDNYSSVLLYNDLGWHELFRGDRAGLRIRKLHVQSNDGDEVDKLWFDYGGSLMWVPLEINPDKNSNYRFGYYGTVETGNLYYGKHDVEKFWKSVKVVVECDYIGWSIDVDYKVDNIDGSSTGWTNIGTITPSAITDDPSNTLDISGNVTGKFIQFRMRVYNSAFTDSPKIKSLSVDFIEQVPTKDSYQMSFIAEDNNVTLQGTPSNDRVETGMAQLETWLDQPNVCTINSLSSMVDGKSVKILEMSYKWVVIDEKQQKEKLVCTMTVIET